MKAKPSAKESAKKIFIFVAIILVCSFVFLAIEQGYLGLFLFFLAIAISVVLTFLYFIYFSFFYRWARWGLAVVTVITAAFLIRIYWNEIESRAIDYYSDITLPNKYKNYKYLEEIAHYAENGKTISYLSEREKGFYSLVFLNDKNELIYSRDKGGEEYLLKYNTQGNIIDSLTIRTNYERATFVGNYFLNINNNYYNTWAIDGDTLSKPITYLKETDDWDTPKRKEFLEKTLNTADYLYLTEINKYTNTNDSIQSAKDGAKVFFQKNNQWMYFYIPIEALDYYEEDYYGGKILSKGKNIDLIESFYKKATVKETHKRGMIRPKYVSYKGYLYTDVVVDNVTFHIKEYRGYYAYDYIMKETTSYFSNKTESLEDFSGIRIYSNKNLQYNLFTNVEKRMYIIK